jgi:hypothetical protein
MKLTRKARIRTRTELQQALGPVRRRRAEVNIEDDQRCERKSDGVRSRRDKA